MHITDQAEADKYFAELVQDMIKELNIRPEFAPQIAKYNLHYYAHFYGTNVMKRVHKLFNCWEDEDQRQDVRTNLRTDDGDHGSGRR